MSLLVDHLISAFEFDSDGTNSVAGAQDATLINSPAFVSALIGNGMDCEADDESYAQIANADAAEWQFGTNSRTVEIWCKPESLPPSGQGAGLAWMGSTSSSDTGWHIIYNNSGGTGQFVARLATGTTLFTATASGYPADGSTYHVVASYDRSGNLQVFVNNVRAASTGISAASAVNISSDDNVKFGGEHGTQAFFDGVIDAVRLWGSALGNRLNVIDWLWNDGAGRTDAEIVAVTTVGGRFRENFGSLSTGTGTPAGFTALGSTNTTFEVVTDGASEGGKALEIQKSGAGRARLTLDDLDGKTQQDIVMLFEVDTTGRAPGLIINSRGAAGAETEYLLEAFGTALTIWEGVSGSYTSRDTASAALPSALTSGVVYAMRFRRQADTYYGRIWIPASEDEPADWDVDTLDGSPRGAGGAGISFPSSAGTLTVHYLSAAIGNDCGCVLPDADFPNVGLYATSETDGSLRVYDEADASINGVVSIFGGTAIANVRACAVHMANQTVFVAKRFAGPVVRVDRYGLNETVINDTIANPYGLDIDESADLLFITDRDAGQCYTDDIAGGNQANPLTVATASHVHWEDANSRLWWVANGKVFSGNASFGSSTDYGTPPATPGHAISDGTTVIVSDFDAAGADGVFSKPVASPGDSFATADGTSLLDAFTINSDLDTPYATGATVGAIIKWSVYPPTAGTRSTFATLAGGRYVDWFDFSASAPVDFPLTPAAMDASTTLEAVALAFQALAAPAAMDAVSTIEGTGLSVQYLATPAAMDAAVSMEPTAISTARVFQVDPEALSCAVTMDGTALSTGRTLQPGEMASSVTMDAATLAALVGLTPADLGSAVTMEAVAIGSAGLIIARFPFRVRAETRTFSVAPERRTFTINRQNEA